MRHFHRRCAKPILVRIAFCLARTRAKLSSPFSTWNQSHKSTHFLNAVCYCEAEQNAARTDCNIHQQALASIPGSASQKSSPDAFANGFQPRVPTLLRAQVPLSFSCKRGACSVRGRAGAQRSGHTLLNLHAGCHGDLETGRDVGSWGATRVTLDTPLPASLLLFFPIRVSVGMAGR